MKNSRLAVVVASAILALAASDTGAAVQQRPMPLMVPQASSPAACAAEARQARRCGRWYVLNEQANPDACRARRISGERCGRWYSVGAPAPKPVKEEVIVLRGINFDTSKADIKPESVPILEKNITNLQK